MKMTSYMTEFQKEIIQNLIDKQLDIADQFWEESGSNLEDEESKRRELAFESLNMSESIVCDSAEPLDTRLPGVPKIPVYKSRNEELIALVADMRDSTKHAKTQINVQGQSFSPLRRIFLETSALLPAIEKTINFENGEVTEYLGDGVLGFFQLTGKDEDIYKVNRTAKRIIFDVRELVNNSISNRYGLPKEIHIGVGLAKSHTIIHAIGLDNKKHAKAFGSCVYDATKLSSGRNKIGVSPEIKKMWPQSSGGQIRFKAKKFLDIFPGFELTNSNE